MASGGADEPPLPPPPSSLPPRPPGQSAPPPPPPTPPPPAEAVSAAVEEAASTLNAILSTQPSLGLDVAQEVASFVSELIGVQASTRAALSAPPADGAVGSDDAQAEQAEQAERATEAAAESLTRAVMSLAGAVASSPAQGEVVLTSPNLNLTTEARPASEVASRPVQCDTASDVPVTVTMQPTVLLAAEGVNTSLPLQVILYTVPDSLHASKVGGAAGSDGQRRARRRVRRRARLLAGVEGQSAEAAAAEEEEKEGGGERGAARAMASRARRQE